MLFSPFLFARVTPESSRHSYNNSRPSSRTELLLENKKPSYIDNLGIMDDQKRRLSEAGVNRRPSAAHVLTEGELSLCQISFSKKGRMGLGHLILFRTFQIKVFSYFRHGFLHHRHERVRGRRQARPHPVHRGDQVRSGRVGRRVP